MGKSKRHFTASESAPPSSKLATGSVPINKLHPIFSFRYLDHDHNRFGVHAIRDTEEWRRLTKQLRQISQMEWERIKQSGTQFRAHEISETKRSHPQHIGKLPPIFSEFVPFQFKAFDECRIVGFFDARAIFNIVWIDREHAIYPD
ncbi:MAG: hypothetical protein HY928_16245 [Elusimicrobia bacterium]|nr:hypothetical protein [Elusimicrobiota bacterium]